MCGIEIYEKYIHCKTGLVMRKNVPILTYCVGMNAFISGKCVNVLMWWCFMAVTCWDICSACWESNVFIWRMFAVMQSTLQQSPRLDGMAYQGLNVAFLCVLSTLQAVSCAWQIGWGENVDFLSLWSTLQAVSLIRQIGCDGESVEFLMVCLLAVSWTRWNGWLQNDCKHSKLVACLPAGSTENHDMHGPVETCGCPDADVLAAVFSGFIFLSTLEDSSRAVQSASLGQSLSMQGIILTRLTFLQNGGGSCHFLFPFLGIHSHLLFFLFNLSLLLPPSDIIKTWKAFCLAVWKYVYLLVTDYSKYCKYFIYSGTATLCLMATV